ncbi:hypothetical protein [Streptomyces lutosisoli]|uniref:Uncharacterized protein n=1 Tax=Streptomyces lutosisoli TaxID=2665721 RepID=A0ABW2VTE0_9ACTN
MAQNSADGTAAAYEEALQGLGRALTELRRQRGAPSFDRIRVRGVKLFGEKGACAKATQSKVFSGRQFISLDKLIWLVLTLLSWDENGMEYQLFERRHVPPTVLEPWRQQWFALDALRAARRGRVTEAEDTAPAHIPDTDAAVSPLDSQPTLRDVPPLPRKDRRPLISRAQEGRVREHSRLDYEWFSAQVYGSTSNVKILDICSDLFGPQFSERFFRGVRSATENGARVQILLLGPDSFAISLLSHEEGESSADIRRDIMRNLRTLYSLARRLGEDSRPLFEVRLCSTPLGMTLYRWGDRSLVSFPALGRPSGNGVQLEVVAKSAFGAFVEQGFDELWLRSTPLERFTHAPVTLVDSAGGRREFSCRFVVVEYCVYVTGPDLLSYMAGHRFDQLSVYSAVSGGSAGACELIVVDDESDLHASLIQHFAEKYDASAAAFVWLRPRAAGGVQ